MDRGNEPEHDHRGMTTVDHVYHVYFYAATAAPAETIDKYLARAYELGRTYDTSAAVSSAPNP